MVMKYIVHLMFFLLLTATVIDADTKSSFVESASEFHNLDVELLQKDKTLSTCMNCHLFDKKLQSLSNWLTPRDSIDATVQNFDYDNGEPDPFSKACLMCHDGNTASLVLNAPISPCGLKGNKTVSMDGQNHPVFMKYEYKKDLNSPSSSLNGKWKDAKTVNDLLRDEKVVCISCHIPHHKKNEAFIRTSTKGSGLCLGCHNK